MDGSIRITAKQRKSLLAIVRSKSGNEVRRALIVLHAAAGKSYRWIAEALFTAFDTIASVRESWIDGGRPRPWEPRRPSGRFPGGK